MSKMLLQKLKWETNKKDNCRSLTFF
jgi:hypothetical protein